MSFNCKYCGKELPDDAEYCSDCGATFERVICLSCGERLDPGTTLCPACGARIYNTAAEGPAEMEELVPPVITDDMFSTRPPEPVAPVIESADESVFMRPRQQAAPAAPAQPAAPPPAPAQAVKRPEPIPVPIRAKPQAPAQSAPLLNRPRPAAQAHVPQQEPVIDEQESYVSTSSSGFAEAARPPQQPQSQQQPEMPFGDFAQKPYPDPSKMRIEPGKKGRSMLVPIILIVLIIAVILIDVFVLFRDRIFGSDDSKSSKSAAVVMLPDDIT